MKKYELTKETIDHYGKTLHRIKSLSTGELGGFIESENNLSQYNRCWVHSNAKVFGTARVCGNAMVFDDAKVFGNAQLFSNARVSGYAKVSGNAEVFGNANVFGNAMISGNARVCGYAKVCGDAMVCGNAEVSGDDIATGLVQTCTIYKYNITMTDERISMGCENHTIEYWKENIHRIGLNNSYTPDEINAVIMIITGMLTMRGSK